MRKSKWLQAGLLVIILFIGVYAVGINIFIRHSSVPSVGGKPPSFTLRGMDGKTHSLSDYQSKLLIINFWGSFCPPCRAEMPAIESKYVEWKNRGVNIVGIDLGESTITVKGFVKEVGVTYPILYDPNLDVAHLYKVNQYPTTFFIQNGRIKVKSIGEMTLQYLDNTITDLMAN